MPLDVKKQIKATPEELAKLISFNFPKLDEADVLRASEELRDFDKNQLETILHPGKSIIKQGKRVQAAYIKTSPLVYKIIGDQDFLKWLSIFSNNSKLSFSCIEGFLESSSTILKKGGLSLLEKWTELGGLLAEKNNQFAIVYFNHTADIIDSPAISTELDFEKFRDFIEIGEKLASSNIRTAEAYFEYLPEILSFLPPENFLLFFNIIERFSSIEWTGAVDILAEAKAVFSVIPPGRQKEFLISLDEFVNCTGNGAEAALALFRNAPPAMEKLDDKDFELWVSVAKEIKKTSTGASIEFLNRSPDTLAVLKIGELKQWSDRAIINLSSKKQSFEKFYSGSFRGMGKHLKTLTYGERESLLDSGVILSLINPDCIDSYFDFAPVALRLFSDDMFKKWVEIGFKISKENSNSGSIYFKNSVISFKKISFAFQEEIFKIAESLLDKDWLLAGKFFESLPDVVAKVEPEDLRKWAGTGMKVYTVDRNLTVDYFTHSPMLLKDLDITELEEWAINGLRIFKSNVFLGRPYFSLRSRSSKDFVEGLTGGATLKKVTDILRYYAIGLSGISFKIRSKKELPIYDEKSPINPVVLGRTIYLEPKIKLYDNFEDNFKVYKLSVMHEVGHNKFSSSQFPLETANRLINEIIEEYGFEGTKACWRDVQFSEAGILLENPVDISAIMAIFPNRRVAASIFGMLEDARVEYLIMGLYRGVRSDLESMRHRMLLARQIPEGELEKLVEALLWISTSHEPNFELSENSRFLLNRITELLHESIFQSGSSTLTSLQVTFTVYKIFEEFLGSLETRNYRVLNNIEYRGVGLSSAGNWDPFSSESQENLVSKHTPDSVEKVLVNSKLPEDEKKEKKPEYAMEKNWKVLGSYGYDEWDYMMKDYKSEWSTVHEIELAGKSNEYYKDASERYRNEISLVKSIFSRMKPESFHKLKGQIDGTEIDIDAFTEALLEKKCGINLDEKFYVRWDKRTRDVATLFLVDVSFSTRKILDGEGKRILDIEKDALVIMIQALESMGDKYAIHAFSGHTREDVEYYIIKEFSEEMSGKVEQRIGLLEPVANTRLGPAIRHSIKKLEYINADTKVLILLSDGEPYDTCCGEGVYQGRIAEEDSKVAIVEGNSIGIHFFCITVDTNPGDYLDTIFSESGYTIIDDAHLLPERLPLLYRYITT